MDLKKHRKISAVISFMFIFSILLPRSIVAQAIVSDSTAPIVKSVSVNNTGAKVGSTVVVTVEAEDNASGLAQEANLCYVTETGEIEKGVTLALVDGKYVGEVNIDDTYTLGTWKVGFITVEDNEKNVSIVYNSRVHKSIGSFSATIKDLSGGDINVMNVEDINAPEFLKISVNHNQIQKYDNVKIAIEAVDDLSGLAGEANLCYVSTDDNEVVEKEVSLSLVNGVYEGNINIDDSFGIGNWAVSFITLQDNENNVDIIYNSGIHPELGRDLSSGNLYLNEDIAAPQFNGILVERVSGKEDNDKVTVKVQASDDMIGLAEEANLCYVLQKDGKDMEKEITLTLEDGEYVAELNVDDSFIVGVWKVSFITLQDKANNVAVIYNSQIHQDMGIDLSAGDINLSEDTSAPIFQGISVSSNDIKLYDTLLVEVKATDNSGLAEEANLCYVSEVDGKVVEKEVTLNLVDGNYVGKVSIDETYRNGNWMISFITLQDKLNNVAVIYNSKVHNGLGVDLAAGDISLSEDISGPIFQELSISSKTINLFDTLIIEVKATDDSGLAEDATLCYEANVAGKVVEKEVGLELEDGKYIGKISVDETYKNSDWKVSFITLQDKNNNVTIIYNSMIHNGLGVDLSAGDISLNEDILGPVFEGISVSTNFVSLYDNLNIEVKATDNSELAEEANLSYVSEVNGKAVEKEVTLELKDGKYVGNLSIDETYGVGSWNVSFITLQDKANNTTIIYNSKVHNGLGIDLSAADINLTSDIAGPIFEGMSVSANIVNLYENVVVEVNATDNSDLADEANLCYVSEVDGKVLEKEVTLKLENGKYVGKLSVDETYGVETWKVSFITLQDKADNVTIVYNSKVHEGLGVDLSTADLRLNVDGGNIIFKNITLTSSNALQGDKVGILLSVSDSVPLKETADMCYVLKTPFGDIEKEVTLDKLEDGQYLGVIDVDKNFYSGLWHISFITVEDINDNVIVIYNSKVHEGIGTDLSSGDINSLVDLSVEVPVVENLGLGNTTKVSVKASSGLIEAQDVTLIVGIYDNNHRLIKYVATTPYRLLHGQSIELTSEIEIPTTGNYKLKVFVWDSIKGMTPLIDTVEYTVE